MIGRDDNLGLMLECMLVVGGRGFGGWKEGGNFCWI